MSREGSISSNRSYIDYDTDEVRKRWRLSTPPRARSLTREEAREIIDRQSIDDNYTGYTYGDSISYRSDGNIEYLHPYLSGRKYLDFGSGGDVTNYRPAPIRQQRRKKAFYTDVLEWAKYNGVDSATAAFNWILSAFMFIFRCVAAVGMLIASFAHFAYQKVVGAISSFSTRSAAVTRSPTLVSPGKRTRSPRRRMHVSFSSPVDDQLSFRQTSTPLASTPAVQTLQKSNYVPPLHTYVWLYTHRFWEIMTTVTYQIWETVTSTLSTVVNQASGNSSSAFNSTWTWIKSATTQISELFSAAFTYIFQNVSNAYFSIYDSITSRFHSAESQTPRRRGRPPKTPRAQESRLAPLKAKLDDGTAWTVNKLEGAAEGLAFLSWSAVNSVTNTVNYVQNNYASAQKSRNWLPLLLLLLLLLSMGLYGYQNKQHGRNLTTAVYQDSLVLRQWAAETRDSLPNPMNLLNSGADLVKQGFSNIGAFFSGVFHSIRQGIVSFFNLLPTPWKLIDAVADQVKRAFSAISNLLSGTVSTVYNFFASILDSGRQGFWKVYSYLPSPSKAASGAAEQTKRFFSSATSFVSNVIYDIGSFFANVLYGIGSFFESVLSGIGSFFANLFSYVPSPSNVVNTVTGTVQWIGSKIVDAVFNIYEGVRHGFWKAYSYVPSTSKVFGGASEQIKYIFSSIGNFLGNIISGFSNFFGSLISGTKNFIVNVFSGLSNFFGRGFSMLTDFSGDVVSGAKNISGDVVSNAKNISGNVYESSRQGLWNAYSYIPSPSNAYHTVSKPIQQLFSYINVIIIDALNAISSWAYKPPVSIPQTAPSEIKERIVERVIHEPVSIDMSEVERLIEARISRYDADKTGKPDYALESSGGSIVGIGCTEVYEETSRLQSIFGIPLYFSNYSPRTVIQRRANSPTAGECWPYVGGHGELFVKLSHKINVTSVSYEHLSPRLSPEGHMKTAPKEFRVWSIHNHKQSDERKHLLGEYVYVDGGEALQTFETQFPDELSTEIIGLETFTNHGSPVTCLYRFRVHGQPAIKTEL